MTQSSDIKTPVNLAGRRSVLAGILGLPVLAACETIDPAILDGIANGGFGTIGGLGGLTQADAAMGIREALANGVVNAITTVGKTDGYFSDGTIKIPLPSALQDVQSVLTQFGAGSILANLQLQLNRGAEQAAPYAKDLFIDVISNVSITDAINIVQGSSTAATAYLQDRTTPKLVSLFTPIMSNALGNTGALQLMDQVVGSLRNVPFAPQLSADAKTDLIEHGVGYGLGGLFHYIGEQEAAIRANPAERTSEILRRVFA